MFKPGKNRVGTSQARSTPILPKKDLPSSITDSISLDAQLGRRGQHSVAAASIGTREAELIISQAEMQAILEERDRDNKRLQKVNEEMQSSNEELTVANQQLHALNKQLRASQDYAESIVETIHKPFVVLNADFQLQSANTAFYQFYQVTPTQVEQRSFFELGNGQWDRPLLRELLVQARAANQSFHDVEVEHCFPGIGHKIIRLAGHRIVHEREGSKDHLILLVMEDITAHKEIERQKEALLGVVGHELITPLSGVKLSVQILQRQTSKAGDEQTATELGKVDAQLDVLSHLIGSLLDANTLQTGTLSVYRTSFAIDGLIRNVVEEFGSHRLLIEETVQVEAYGDRERTGQVVRNLLSNALKYSSLSDLVRVSVSVDEAMITVCVQDSGIGIPQDQQAKIFERFVRIDQPEQGKVPGVGLGLYIAAQIVTQQGGQIWVESASGKGTTVFFNLPRALPSKVA